MRTGTLANQLLLDKYLALGLLFEGSLGSIYLGRAERGRGDPVFVKSITPLHLKSEDAIELFETEVKTLLHISHPNLVEVIDSGADAGVHLVVSEYLSGFDLGHWLAYSLGKDGGLPIGVAVHVAIKALEGLQALHGATDANGAPRNLVHRNLMPSNIVIEEGGRVAVTDYGLSRILSEGTAVLDPDTSKLAYLTPELVANADPDPRSDVYGVALILYELLSGSNPFDTGNLGSTISTVLAVDPPPITEARKNVPAALSEVIARALSKKPEDRHASATELALALAPFDADPEVFAERVAEDFRDPKMLELNAVRWLV